MNALESLKGIEGIIGNVLRPVRDRVDIDDVLQDAAIAILQSYAKAPRKKAVWTAKSAARAAFRSKKCDQKYFEKTPNAVYSNPLAALIHCEEVDQLHDALACLDDRQREVIRLRYFEGMTLEEVGESIGLTKQGAANVVSRALEKLREVFGK